MIKEISWKEIEYIWKNYLWPNRMSPIESNSAMNFLSGYNNFNMTTKPTFFGYFDNNILVGVNSGHMCENNQYRLRGHYVHEKYRNRGIGTELVKAVIDQAKLEDAKLIWCIPRKTSWGIYQKLGFQMASGYFNTETNENNFYCVLHLK